LVAGKLSREIHRSLEWHRVSDFLFQHMIYHFQIILRVPKKIPNQSLL
jgi:hypothetical protein